MSKLQAGTVETLKVSRTVDFGYFLSNGTEEVLLHKNDLTETFNPEEPVEVFLYQDHQGRLASSMVIPSVQLGKYDWCEVVNSRRSLGVFVAIGISKDMLVSKDDLPELLDVWPEKSDKLYCTLVTDKKGRLFAKMADHEVMESLKSDAIAEDFNKNVAGHVYQANAAGSFVFTEEKYIGFLHENERKQEPRIGQRIEGRVIDVKEDGTVNLSLLRRSHEVMDEDAEAILAYMDSREGAMPYGDKTSPEDIKNQFGISKAAFKRAMGRLMKDDKAYQKDGWTYRK